MYGEAGPSDGALARSSPHGVRSAGGCSKNRAGQVGELHRGMPLSEASETLCADGQSQLGVAGSVPISLWGLLLADALFATRLCQRVERSDSSVVPPRGRYAQRLQR